MRTVNRSALVIRPKQPYIDWAGGIDADAPDHAVALQGRVSVYLVADDPAGIEESASIDGYYEMIFEAELAAWSRDEATWPKRRDLATFHQWFEMQAESIVVDLERSALTIDE